MRVIHDLHSILAHWIYTREEWESFLRWKKLRRGFFHYAAYSLFGKRAIVVPEITITGMKIWINDEGESFMDQERKLKRINIKDSGTMNILEIIYEKINGKQRRQHEIRIPVPKGKLREAIELQESLGGYTI